MEKFATIYVMDGNRLYGTVENMSEVNEMITELVGDNKSFDFSRIRLLNVLDEMELDDDIVETVPGEVRMNDESECGTDEEQYKINDGQWQGKTFDDIDDVSEFFKEKIESGRLTLEEVKYIDVIREKVETIRFDNVWQEDDEYRIKVEELNGAQAETYNRMGLEFIPASKLDDVNKRVAAYIEEHTTFTPVGDMTDEDMHSEMHKLLARVQQLQQEKRRREDAELEQWADKHHLATSGIDNIND